LEHITQLLTFEAMQQYVSSHSWVWPVCEMAHYVGMSIIVGFIGFTDLRILGLCKRLPIGALKPYVPVVFVVFLLANVFTGLVFVTGNSVGGAATYTENLSFQLKMAMLVLIFINLMVFQISGLEAKVYDTPANGDAPAAAKVIALVSIVCWLLVIFFGRMLMYNDTLLLFLGI
jgi:hypothetical protein